MNLPPPARAQIALALLLALAAPAPLLAGAAHPATRARESMVVTPSGIASRVGLDILRRGGNAIDAAVATGFALAVIYPTAGNIGGGGFLLARTADGEVHAFDFREMAPAAATPTMYLDADGQLVKGTNHDGHRAVAVPGTVAGFDLARERLGRLPWGDLVEPAVALARDGFPLSWALADDLARHADDWRRNPAAARSFLKPDGSTYRPGEILRQPDLARTLERIRRDGRDGFYRGETARLVAEDMRRNGGLITEEDLAAYKPEARAPIRGTFRGFDIYSMPPPSSGGIALVEMLNILEPYDLAALGHNSAGSLHLLTEAMRRAYADRARSLGDPDFNPDLPAATLTSKEHAARLRAAIRQDRASRSDPSSFDRFPESEQTTHYSIVDREGNAVAVTYTLEYAYGARIVADGAGFLYNNEMGDFNPHPGRTDPSGLIGTPPNTVAPRKRPLSSMTPTIVTRDGKTRLVLGSPGGRTIINTVLQVVLNVTAFDMDVARAVAAGRVHHQWLPDELVVERDSTSPDTLKLLRQMGHATRERPSIGRVMAIAIDPVTGIRHGAADPREPDGEAIGD